MSQRPAATHDDSNTQKDGRSITLPPVNILPQDEGQQASRQEARSGDAPTSQSTEQYSQQAPALYLPMQSADDRPATSASRSLGFHNILNPAEPENTRSSPSLPAKASPAVPSAGPTPEERMSPPQPSGRAKRPLQSPSMSSGEVTDCPRPRKTLYPKSPRSMSLGGSGTGVFLQSTKQQPGLEPATGCTITPGTYAGSSIPPLPSLPPQPPYGGYNFLLPVSTPPLDQRRSAGTSGPSGLSRSQHTSPQTSYFAYSGQPSTAQQLSRTPGPFTTGHYQTMESHMGALRPSKPAIKQEEGPYNPMHGSLSMPGNHGPQHLQGGRISVALDRVSGSRSADEKRKHNAAASSRFRERRKKLIEQVQKENDELVKENKELKEKVQKLEEAERERDYYQNAYHSVIGSGGGAMLQSAQPPPPFRGVSYGHPAAPHPRPADNDDGRPAQRRRTQGPGQGEGYTFPPATTYRSTPGYQLRADDGRAAHGLQIPGPPRSAPGSMSAPSSMPLSPYEQYPPATNGGGYFRGLHSGPPTPAPSQSGSSQPGYPSSQQQQPPPQGGERR